MPTAGNPNFWARAFPTKFIPEILALIEESWGTFDAPNSSELEVPLALRFCCHLRLRKNALRSLPMWIERESVEDDLEAAKEKGRIDIRFVSAGNCREEIYFAVECKRLSVPIKKKNASKSLAADYVEKGMMRYVSGQYAAAVRHGAMVGFVMDGDVAKAIDSVKTAVVRRRKKLKMQATQTLASSTIAPGRPAVKETFHRLAKGRLFRIHHVFLSVA